MSRVLVGYASKHGSTRDHVVFGGRLPTEPGNFMERAMVKNTSPEQRDRGDWEQIRSWAARIGADLPVQTT